ncbi:MAG: hypothetical protein JWM50_2211 [Microbacteriaceae bacterium]|jgi:hypothetical protein|nr:hypothetical protein [Microbacteriaceae bacterium]
MIIDTVTFDGAVFALSGLEAVSLRVQCLEANGHSGYVNFSTADGQEISMLVRPDSSIYFASFESASEVAPLATLGSPDVEDFLEFDPEWSEYVA